MAYNKKNSKDATNKYCSKFDLIQIRARLGMREIICSHAAKKGESMNSFNNRAIEETIERNTDNIRKKDI